MKQQGSICLNLAGPLQPQSLLRTLPLLEAAWTSSCHCVCHQGFPAPPLFIHLLSLILRFNWNHCSVRESGLKKLVTGKR